MSTSVLEIGTQSIKIKITVETMMGLLLRNALDVLSDAYQERGGCRWVPGPVYGQIFYKVFGEFNNRLSRFD